MFGTRHERERKRVQPIVDEINEIGERLTSRQRGGAARRRPRNSARSIRERTAALERADRRRCKDAKKAAADPDGARADRRRARAAPTARGGARGEVPRRRSRDVLDETPARGVRHGARGRAPPGRAPRCRSPATTLTWDMVPYDVQLIGGIVLHQGRIAEMATGEGKTLVATLPLYLNALTGRGAHLVTVNNYLARRDSQWMGHLYTLPRPDRRLPRRHRARHRPSGAPRTTADITYGTNNEFGFDYLRDNMVFVARAAGAARARLRDHRRSGLGPDRRGADAAHHLGPGRATRRTTTYAELNAAGRAAGAQADGARRTTLVARGREARSPTATTQADGGDRRSTRRSSACPKNKRLLKLLQRAGRQAARAADGARPHRRPQAAGAQAAVCATSRRSCYFVLDEKGHSVHLTDRGVGLHVARRSRALFVLPDISRGDRTASRRTRDLTAAGEGSTRAAKIEARVRAQEREAAHHPPAAAGARAVREGRGLRRAGRPGADRRRVHRPHRCPAAAGPTGCTRRSRPRKAVQVKGETQTLATITIQNYFRMYEKLAGMTGTAETEETEFFQIYRLEVAVIPTNRPMRPRRPPRPRSTRRAGRSTTRSSTRSSGCTSSACRC